MRLPRYMSGKELLFSVTTKDCKWFYARGRGKGGQKRNKTSTAVVCVHIASGATGKSDDTRSQHQNKRIAFKRMLLTKKFKNWHKMEIAKRLGIHQQAKDRVEHWMKPWFLKEETYDPNKEGGSG